MQIAHDHLRLDFKGAHQVRERLLKELETGQVFQITEMLALIGETSLCQRENAFQVPANGEHGRHFKGEFDAERHIPARAANELRAPSTSAITESSQR